MAETAPQPSGAPAPKQLYLFDGSGFIFRAYHVLPPLTNPQGQPVGAVLGFMNILLKLRESHKGDYMAVIFDAGRKTFRNELYSDYKAHRPPAPDDLIPQFALVRDATRALNIPAIELDGFEADDLIATYAAEGRKAGMEVVIVSSDKDLMQLIGEGVGMFDPMKQKVIGHAEVMEKFGVAPDRVRDVLSLIGDSSDNVPGVPGIGPKTAAELINLYGDLEGLLSRAHEIKQPKRRDVIMQHADKARLSHQLISLKHDVPLPMQLHELETKEPDTDVLFGFLQQHNFKTLILRLQQKMGLASVPQIATPAAPVSVAAVPTLAPVEKRYSIIRDEQALSQWIAKAHKKGMVAFDTETTSVNALQAKLVGFSLCCEVGEACYVPLAHVRGKAAPVQSNMFDDCDAPTGRALAENQIPFDRAMQMIGPLLADPSVLKIGHNMKYDMLVMQRQNIFIAPIEDTMLLSYALHAGEHGQSMDELSERYLGYKPISYNEVTGTGKSRICFDEVEIDRAGEYAAEDADVTMRMYEFFKPQLFAKRLITLHETIERPLIPVLARMETFGVKVDVARLGALSGEFLARMQEHERDIYRLAGHEFNIGSPKQLGEVLFDEMQLPGGKKSKTGAYSTDSFVLEELIEQGFELPSKVMEWRQLSKLKSTYSDSLPQQIDPATGRIHTSYAMALTTTGRLSSSDPNLQNIPIRSIEGKKIREAFIADEGYTLLSADYSQIELRLLAHVADIPVLKDAFRNGDDIHAITASQMFGKPVSEVNADLRRSAKTINFGIIYGISAHGLASRLGISRGEAATYITQYFTQYPGIRDYMESAKEFAREHGYVETLFGRRCHVPGIKDKNGARRSFSERAAINAPLQGTAADIIKRAMITIDAKLPLADARMLLQVHDELVFEVRPEALERSQAFIKAAMEQAASLSVPLTVETGHGSHWGDAH